MRSDSASSRNPPAVASIATNSAASTPASPRNATTSGSASSGFRGSSNETPRHHRLTRAVHHAPGTTDPTHRPICRRPSDRVVPVHRRAHRSLRRALRCGPVRSGPALARQRARGGDGRLGDRGPPPRRSRGHRRRTGVEEIIRGRAAHHEAVGHRADGRRRDAPRRAAGCGLRHHHRQRTTVVGDGAHLRRSRRRRASAGPLRHDARTTQRATRRLRRAVPRRHETDDRRSSDLDRRRGGRRARSGSSRHPGIGRLAGGDDRSVVGRLGMAAAAPASFRRHDRRPVRIHHRGHCDGIPHHGCPSFLPSRSMIRTLL